MWLSVDHVTTYAYDRPVKGVQQSHRLVPAVFDGQKVADWQVEVPGGIRGGAFRDGAGDGVQAWSVPGPVETVEVRVRGLVQTADLAGVLRGHREAVPPGVWLTGTAATRADAAIAALAGGVASEASPLAAAHALMAAVADRIVWTPGATGPQTSAAEALAQGTGVCQDHAQVMIAAARAAGLPARYVAGYLFADGTEAQAAHAWAEVHVEALGWVGFDAANRTCPDARYIRLCCGFDAADAAPIRGTARGGVGAEALTVTVRVAEAQAQSQQ